MKLESITIRVAENGFTVSCSEREEESDKKSKSKGDGCCISSWEPPKDYVFESADGALAYAKGKLGGGKPKYESFGDRVRAKAKAKGAK